MPKPAPEPKPKPKPNPHPNPTPNDTNRTNHAAQPVTQGIKFAANMWIHQFDFKTPSERGCQLTYVNTVGANLALALALAQTQAQTQALP